MKKQQRGEKEKYFYLFFVFLKKENIRQCGWTADLWADQAAQPGFLKFPRQKSPQPAHCVVTWREERCAEMVLWFCRVPRHAARLQQAGRGHWEGKGFRASQTFLLLSHLDLINHIQWLSVMAAPAFRMCQMEAIYIVGNETEIRCTVSHLSPPLPPPTSCVPPVEGVLKHWVNSKPGCQLPQ